MILVVDSGSTKTDWIALGDDGTMLFQTQTLGLNPQVLSQEILKERIINNFELYKHRNEVSRLYFYGAGCGVEKPRKLISEVFEEFFKEAQAIIVKEDTYAALYATVDTEKKEKAIVCILGTGSNCSYYNGHDIEQKVMHEMFESSVDGEAYDADRWSQYFRPAGMQARTGDPQQAASPQATATSQSAPAPTPTPVAETTTDTGWQEPAPAAAEPAGGAQDILAMIRSRQG